MNMDQQPDGWPEITYQYVMHYFWEPNHLFLKKDEEKISDALFEAKKSDKSRRRRDLVLNRMKAEEVPLNYFLNVLLRILPASVRHLCLHPFGVDLSGLGLNSLSLITPDEFNFRDMGLKTQPDVHLESESARVFIEVKANDVTPLTLQQIHKYVRLHTKLDEIGGQVKRCYVLFLVPSDRLTIDGIGGPFDHDCVGEKITVQLGPEASGITFRSATWKSFAQTLNAELDRRRGEQTEAVEILTTLIGDFLADLKRRKLMT